MAGTMKNRVDGRDMFFFISKKVRDEFPTSSFLIAHLKLTVKCYTQRTLTKGWLEERAVKLGSVFTTYTPEN